MAAASFGACVRLPSTNLMTNEIVGYRLSPQQKRLWGLLPPGNRNPYTAYCLASIDGDLDEQRLVNAVRNVARAHGVLRTRLRYIPGMRIPVQLVDGVEPVIEKDLEALNAKDGLTPEEFDLEWGPLVKVILRQASTGSHLMEIRLPALYSDLKSLAILLTETAERYAEEPAEPAADELCYTDIAEWQNELLEDDEASAGKDYWRKQKVAIAPELGFEKKGPRPEFAPRVLTRVIERDHAEELERACRRMGAALDTYLLSCWRALLSRLTGRKDVTIGLYVDGRNYEELENAHGLFARYVPICAEVSPESLFESLLDEMQTLATEGHAWQECFNWDLVAGMDQLDESPFFFYCFCYSEDVILYRAGHVTFRLLEKYAFIDRFRLKLSCRRENGGLYLDFLFDSEIYEEDDVAEVADRCVALIAGAVRRSKAAIGDLDILTSDQRDLLLKKFHNAGRDYKTGICAHQLIEEQATMKPDVIAVELDGAMLTYQELDQRANRLANYLRARGANPEVIVGLFLERSADLVVGLLGILKAGAAYLPIDPAYPSERIAYMLDNSGARLLVRHSRLPDVPGSNAETICLDGAWPEILRSPKISPETPVNEENLAYVIYTSGSTGAPKGVAIEHRQLVHYTQAVLERLPSDAGSYAMASTIAADLCNTAVYPALCSGATLHVLASDLVMDADRLSQYMSQRLVDCLKIVPSHFEGLLAAASSDSPVPTKMLVLGGEAASWRLIDLLNAIDHRSRILNHYGPTETTVGVLTYEVGVDRARDLTRSVPLGSPLGNIKAHVLDEVLDLVTVGVAGQLYIGGPGVGRGYINRPDLTAERFIPDPNSEYPGGRLYRTGDVVRRLRSGPIEFLGRADHQIKIRGYRIELGEIESALRSLDKVKQAVVSVREDETHEKRLVAYVTGDVDIGLLKTAITRKLPDYMMPCEIINLERIPLTENGKVDRDALAAIGQRSHEAGRNAYKEPRNHVERVLAEIWSSVLKIDRIGIDDNYFSLGGDSILSIQIVARAKRKQIELTPRQMFEYQTIRELARAASARNVGDAVQEPISGDVALTPIQRRFFARNTWNVNHYNQAVMLETKRPIDIRKMGAGIRTVLEHHDALRLRYRKVQGTEWRQWYASNEDTRVYVHVDLSHVEPASRDREIDKLSDLLQRSLDLTVGPLVRFASYKTTEAGNWKMLILAHHLAVDGVSWRILLEDIQQAYQQLEQGEQIILAEKTMSYQIWAERIIQYGKSDQISVDAESWVQQDDQEVNPVRVDHDLGVNSVGSVEVVKRKLNQDQTRELLARKGGDKQWRIEEALLAALARSYQIWSGQQKLRIDLEGHGRDEFGDGFDLTRTVGWFTSIYPVVLETNSGETRIETVKRVKEMMRAIGKKAIGYGVVRYLTDTGRQRSWENREIVFNYLGQIGESRERGALFQIAEKPKVGSVRDERDERGYLIEISGVVKDDELELSWAYSRNKHRRESIETLAALYNEELELIVKEAADSAQNLLTPFDFPIAALDQQELDKLCAEYDQIEDIYPASPVQEGLVFHSLFGSQPGAYVIQLTCTITRPLNVTAFRRAWQQTVNRHAALRTSFVRPESGKTLQVVQSGLSLPWQELDWRTLAPAEREQELESLLRDDRMAGFDLAAGPLIRFALIDLGDGTFQFLWSHHHLLLDGWTTPLIIKEVFSLYEAYDGGVELEQDRPQPYRKYIEWLERQDLSQLEGFWRSKLAGFGSPTALRLNRPVVQSTSSRYQLARRRLSRRGTETLLEFVRRNHLTLSAVAQGAWSALLSRYSGDDDVLFGVTVSGRSPDVPGIDMMAGLFINTLPARVRLQPEQEVITWLLNLQEQQSEMGQYEHTPLIQVQKWSDLPRGVPLFETILAVESYPIDESLEDHGNKLGVRDVRCIEQTNYPINVSVYPGEEIRLEILYDGALFDSTTIGAMLGHFENLIACIASDRRQRISDLKILTRREEELLLTEWSRTDGCFETEASVEELFDLQVVSTPDRLAVESRSCQLTFAGLKTRVNRVATDLRRIGVGPEKIVGLYTERCPVMVVGMLATLKAGGGYLPLDSSYPKDRLEFMLQDAVVVAVLTQERLRDSLDGLSVPVLSLDHDLALIQPESEISLGEEVDKDNPSYLMYTSGSTGAPKGSLISRRSLADYVSGIIQDLGLGPGDRMLQFASIGFDVVVEEIFPTLLSGACVVFAGTELESYDDFNKTIEEYSVTGFELPTAYWHGWVDELARNGVALPASVRYVITGGERMLADQLAKWPGSSARLIHVYGLTETSVTSTSFHLRAGCSPKQGSELPIGRPLAGTAVYLLDQTLHPVPAGVTGEVYIGGTGLARGYHKRPDLTAERFQPNPLGDESGARFYRTGDLAFYQPDGNMQFAGRSDGQVKVRGVRVEPEEIEAGLRKHESVRDSLVLLREVKPGDKRLIAYIVLRRDDGRPADISAAALRTYLEACLPTYMMPSAFVVLEEWPLTANGKIDKQALKLPDTGLLDDAEAGAGPRSATEEQLAYIWAQVIGAERIGIHDNFFELGGDSIISLQIVSRARSAGIRITPSDIFKNQTVAALALVAAESPQTRAAQESVSGPFPLTPIQRWFFDLDLSNPHQWNMALLLETHADLDFKTANRAFRALQLHHDALRTRFIRDEFGWRQMQMPDPETRNSVLFVDMSAVEAGARKQAIESAAHELQRSLNISTGPLARAAFFELGVYEPSRILFVLHHLIVDGMSWRILLGDLQRACSQVLRGDAIQLEPKTDSFQRWSETLVKHVSDGGLVSEEQYWEEQTRALPPLPVDFEDGENRVSSEQIVKTSLSERETKSLLQAAPKAYGTRIADLLLTALARTYKAWTRRTRLRVDMEGHGREDLGQGLDLSRTVGWFSCQYPVLLDLGDSEDPGDSLKLVKEQLRRTVNGGIGYGLIRYLVNRERSAPAYSADIGFNYMGQFDNTLPPDSLFKVAAESPGPAMDSAAARIHLLEVSARVIAGRLEVDWRYSANRHARPTVEYIAGLFVEELRLLITHCTSPGAGGYTPSDFAKARISQKDLDKLIARVARLGEERE